MSRTLQFATGKEAMVVRIGLFELDKLQDVDGAVKQFEDVLAKVVAG